MMTSERQFSLLPECGDEVWSFLHGFEAIGGELTDLANWGKAEICDLGFLEESPDHLEGVAFGSVWWQACYSDMPFLFCQSILDFATPTRSDAIPDSQRRARDLTFESAEKFDDRFRADRAGEGTEIELPERQTGDCRQMFPGETVLKDRRLAALAPCARHVGTFVQSGFIDEDDGPVVSLGFFFSAGKWKCIASSGQILPRRAGWRASSSSGRRPPCPAEQVPQMALAVLDSESLSDGFADVGQCPKLGWNSRWCFIHALPYEHKQINVSAPYGVVRYLDGINKCRHRKMC